MRDEYKNVFLSPHKPWFCVRHGLRVQARWCGICKDRGSGDCRNFSASRDRVAATSRIEGDGSICTHLSLLVDRLENPVSIDHHIGVNLLSVFILPANDLFVHSIALKLLLAVFGKREIA